MSAKEALIEMIRKMPDDVPAEDLAYELYLRAKVEEGLRQLDNGEGVPHEEVKVRLSRWLS